MKQNYARYVCDYPLLGSALRSLAELGVPALVHCVNGKDRTGVASAVLQRACGVHPDDIMEDYLLYNEQARDVICADEERLSAGMSEDEHAILMSFLEVRPAYLDAFFKTIDDTFGDFETYLERGMRVTSSMRERITALM